MAETLAENGTAWSVAASPEATKAAAVANFASKNAMGKDATYAITIESAYDAADQYATAATAVAAHIGELVSSTDGAYVAYGESVDGVELTAVYGHIDGKKYSYVFFVM